MPLLHQFNPLLISNDSRVHLWIKSFHPAQPLTASQQPQSRSHVSGMMNWLVRMTAELEVSMNSVERVVEYNPLDSEAPAIIEGNRPAAIWPSQGVIQVENLVVRYRPELPPVISNLSFKTGAREKVGSAWRSSHLTESLLNLKSGIIWDVRFSQEGLLRKDSTKSRCQHIFTCLSSCQMTDGAI